MDTKSSKKQESLINSMRLKKKERKEKKEKQLKFSHIHSLVPELASGFGPSLERSRVVEMPFKARYFHGLHCG